MVAVRPDLWPNIDTARWTLQRGVPSCLGFAEVAYQRVGPKQKRRIAHFNLHLIPDPIGWLEERLGPLARRRAAK